MASTMSLKMPAAKVAGAKAVSARNSSTFVGQSVTMRSPVAAPTRVNLQVGPGGSQPRMIASAPRANCDLPRRHALLRIFGMAKRWLERIPALVAARAWPVWRPSG